MKENDDTVGAILFCIKMLIRQVEWHVRRPGGDSAKDKEAAEFVEGCMDDMQATWTVPFRKSYHSCLTVGASMRLYISAEWAKQRTEDHQQIL